MISSVMTDTYELKDILVYSGGATEKKGKAKYIKDMLYFSRVGPVEEKGGGRCRDVRKVKHKGILLLF